MFRSDIGLELLTNVNVDDFGTLGRARQREAANSRSIIDTSFMAVIANIRHWFRAAPVIGVGACLALLESRAAVMAPNMER